MGVCRLVGQIPKLVGRVVGQDRIWGGGMSIICIHGYLTDYWPTSHLPPRHPKHRPKSTQMASEPPERIHFAKKKLFFLQKRTSALCILHIKQARRIGLPNDSPDMLPTRKVFRYLRMWECGGRTNFLLPLFLFINIHKYINIRFKCFSCNPIALQW